MRYCIKHNCATGEGDICGQCEEEFDNYRLLMNLEMSKHQYQLWFVLSMKVLYQCPVKDYDEAKLLYYSLAAGGVTGVRIARHDPQQGCESVLHRFK